MSFVREGSGGKKVVQHQWPMPEGLEGYLDEVEGAEAQREKEENGEEGGGPFLSKRAEILNSKLTPFFHPFQPNSPPTEENPLSPQPLLSNL